MGPRWTLSYEILKTPSLKEDTYERLLLATCTSGSTRRESCIIVEKIEEIWANYCLVSPEANISMLPKMSAWNELNKEYSNKTTGLKTMYGFKLFFLNIFIGV